MERGIEALRARLTVRDAAIGDLSASVVYGILRLRSSVFVVEQHCVYLDPDGRDVERGAVQVWVEDDGQVVACARVLPEPTGSSIGRVVTDPAWRRRGVGRMVLSRAVDISARPTLVHAQSHLVDWYAGFGFEAQGGEFLEEGIPHVAMVLGRAGAGGDRRGKAT